MTDLMCCPPESGKVSVRRDLIRDTASATLMPKKIVNE